MELIEKFEAISGVLKLERLPVRGEFDSTHRYHVLVAWLPKENRQLYAVCEGDTILFQKEIEDDIKGGCKESMLRAHKMALMALRDYLRDKWPYFSANDGIKTWARWVEDRRDAQNIERLLTFYLV